MLNLRMTVDRPSGNPYDACMTGNTLRDWMYERRWTGKRLAEELGVHPSTLQRYRDGTLTIPRTVILALEALEKR